MNFCMLIMHIQAERNQKMIQEIKKTNNFKREDRGNSRNLRQ